MDRPEAAPTVLLDMNDGVAWRTSGEEFDISPPPLTRSLVRNALGDGGVLTAASYDLRELQFTVRLHGQTEAARAAQLKAFETELAKPANLLMYQSQLHDKPVFFRTMRSDTFVLDTQFVPGSVWQIKASVAAEPYAIGIRRDLTPVTVANDPAAVTNPTRFDVPGPIVGDGPAPAFVRINDLGAAGTVILAQRTINNPAALTQFAQAESAVAFDGNTATWNAGTTFSGTPNRATATTITGNTGQVDMRLRLNVPTASSSEALRGRYRVFLRAFAASTATFLIRWRQPGSDGNPGPTVTATITGGAFSLVDLGVAEFPHATTAPSGIGYSGLPPGFSQPQLEIWAGRTAGSANLDLDYVYLMPADERLCSVQQVASTGYLVIDGPNDATYGMAAATTPFGVTRTISNGTGLIPRIGGLPVLVPGVTNRWYMLTSRALSDTRTVEISYWPRWLDVATT